MRLTERLIFLPVLCAERLIFLPNRFNESLIRVESLRFVEERRVDRLVDERRVDVILYKKNYLLFIF